jgi:hypothetical protein
VRGIPAARQQKTLPPQTARWRTAPPRERRRDRAGPADPARSRCRSPALRCPAEPRSAAAVGRSARAERARVSIGSEAPAELAVAIWIGSRRLRRWLRLLSMPQARVARAETSPRRPRCSRPSSTAIARVNTASRLSSSELEAAAEQAIIEAECRRRLNTT